MIYLKAAWWFAQSHPKAFLFLSTEACGAQMELD